MPQRAPVVAMVLAFAALAGLGRWALEPPSVDQARADELVALHQALFRGPRPTGSDEAGVSRGRIAAALSDAGCAPNEAHTWSCREGRCANVVNLWCRVGPEGGPAIVGLAHTDSVPAGPGAADDGAGVVAWVDALRHLPALRRPLVVVLTDGEELGLLGARAFFADPPYHDPIGAVVNLDARGTEGTSVWFELVGASGPFARAWGRAGFSPSGSSAYAAVYDAMPNDTDLTVARAHGLPGVNHAFIGNVAGYHTSNDDLDHLDVRSLAHHADAARGWVDALQTLDDGRDEAMFVDVLGFVRLRMPIAVGVALALATFGAWVGWIVADRRAGRLDGAARGIGLGIASLVGALVGASLLTAGFVALAGPLWLANATVLRLVDYGVTAGAVLALGSLTPVVRWHLVNGVVAVLLAAMLAADARLAVLLLPAWTVGVAVRTATGSVFGSGPALAVACLPLVFGFEDALSVGVAPAIVLPLWLAAAGWPWPVVPGRVLAGTVAGWVGVLLVVALVAPGAELPTNLVFLESRGSAQLSTLTQLGPDRTLPMPPEGLAPPRIEDLGGGRFRLGASRHATRLDVVARGDGPIAVEGVEVEPLGGGLRIDGVPEAGVVVDLRARSLVRVREVTNGLPPGIDVGEERVQFQDGDQTVVAREWGP